MQRAHLVRPALATLTACGVAIVLSPALATHSWGTMHWSRTTGLVIRLGDNVSTAWDSYLRSAATDWSQAAPLDTAVTTGAVSPATCQPTYGRVEVCNANYGNTEWVGIGNVWSSNGHIVQGTVQLNEAYFSQPYYNTPAWRRFVMCQEIGHVLGLDHQDVNYTNPNLGSCMDYTRDPTGTLGTNGTLNNERPNKHDFDQLQLIYNHTDATQLSSTRPTATSAAVKLPPGERGKRLAESRIGRTPGEWGRAVAFTARGRPRLFVKDLGEGIQVATFVIWADETRPHEH